MPKGTKVEEVYQALRKEGMSEEKAAKIAQAQTGLALATGKPPKGKENAACPDCGKSMTEGRDFCYDCFTKTSGKTPRIPNIPKKASNPDKWKARGEHPNASKMFANSRYNIEGGYYVDVEPNGTGKWSVLVHRADGVTLASGDAYTQEDIIKITRPFGKIKSADFWGRLPIRNCSFESGRQKAEQEISNKMLNAVRSGLVERGKTLIYRGREMDVVSVVGNRITLDNDGERYTVNASDYNLEPGTTGD